MRNRKTEAMVHNTAILINDHVFKAIISSITNKSDYKLFSPLVLLAQKECDKVLSSEASSLERILKCAKIIEQYGAGNCLLKCYLALDYLLKSFLLIGLNSYSECIPISIVTTSEHAVLIINNSIVCDPLLGLVTPLDVYTFIGKKPKEYFAIRSNWECFTEKNPDTASTRYTIDLFTSFNNLFAELKQKPFFKEKFTRLMDIKNSDSQIGFEYKDKKIFKFS